MLLLGPRFITLNYKTHAGSQDSGDSQDYRLQGARWERGQSAGASCSFVVLGIEFLGIEFFGEEGGSAVEPQLHCAVAYATFIDFALRFLAAVLAPAICPQGI